MIITDDTTIKTINKNSKKYLMKTQNLDLQILHSAKIVKKTAINSMFVGFAVNTKHKNDANFSTAFYFNCVLTCEEYKQINQVFNKLNKVNELFTNYIEDKIAMLDIDDASKRRLKSIFSLLFEDSILEKKNKQQKKQVA